jgi:hypothetical protein
MAKPRSFFRLLVVLSTPLGCVRIGYDAAGSSVAPVDGPADGALEVASVDVSVDASAEGAPIDAAEDEIDVAVDVAEEGETGPSCDGTYEVVVPAIADTYLDAANPTFNYGASIDLDVTQDGGALILFDSSVIPARTIRSATISVYLTRTDALTGNYGLTLDQLLFTNAGWQEGTGNGAVGGAGESTYANRDQGRAIPWAGPWGKECGANCSAILSQTDISVPASAGRIDFAMTLNVINGWRNAPSANTGVVLDEHNGQHWHFVSREGADASQRPELRLAVDCP